MVIWVVVGFVVSIVLVAMLAISIGGSKAIRQVHERYRERAPEIVHATNEAALTTSGRRPIDPIPKVAARP